MSDTAGYVQEYPCNCLVTGSHACWIVRHPRCSPPVSHPTKQEAEDALGHFQAGHTPIYTQVFDDNGVEDCVTTWDVDK